MLVTADAETASEASANWQADPRVILALLLIALVYAIGWRRLRQQGETHFQPRQLAAFLSALVLIGLDLLSPIDALADRSSAIHMTQHMVLIFVAPVLVWWGRPFLPLYHGLPAIARHLLDWLGSYRQVWGLLAWLTHPVTAWLVFVVVVWNWHLPALYDLALEHETVHNLEHACIFYVSLLFWYPVMRPYPARPRWSRWLLIPYLVLADVQFTVFSAILTFSDHVIYTYYLRAPKPWLIDPLQDQQIAGLVMWIPGSIVFLVPLVWIGAELLSVRPSQSPTDVS